MVTDSISNEVNLRHLKDVIINELHGKTAGIIKYQIKLEHSDQESAENSIVVQRKELAYWF